MDWPSAIKAVASLFKSWGAAAVAFFAGRASAKRDQEKQNNKATKDELDAERKAADILGDPDARNRLRERWKDTE